MEIRYSIHVYSFALQFNDLSVHHCITYNTVTIFNTITSCISYIYCLFQINSAKFMF